MSIANGLTVHLRERGQVRGHVPARQDARVRADRLSQGRQQQGVHLPEPQAHLLHGW